MTKFERAHVPPSEVDRNIRDYVKEWEAGRHELRTAFPAETVEEARQKIGAYFMFLNLDPIYRNNLYQVQTREFTIGEGWGKMLHLSIKRIDRQPIHDWRDLQEIKNQLVGEEHEGVELYPAESRRVDSANQYHLWVMMDKEARFPFGFGERLVTDEPLANSKQRPL